MSWIKKNKLTFIILATLVFTQLGMASVFVINAFIPFSSSKNVLYFVRGELGGIEIKRDLFIEDADSLIFMIDLNGIFSSLKRELAIARHKSSLELNWDGEKGVGNIKQYREDGTIIALSFSRYREDAGELHGLFLGGELPFGDTNRSENFNSSGFGYFDGTGWHHIWCSSNEGFSLDGTDTVVVPPLWQYDGSRVLKETPEEIILESRHQTTVDGALIKMTRHISVRAGDDYYTMKIRFTNASNRPIVYNFAYGDEPWIGDYNSSMGDVGWYEDGIVEYEKFLSPQKHAYAGFWDVGNKSAGEHKGYSGHANFIEWISPTPSYVFFSNSFEDCCDENTALADYANRVLDIVWLKHSLRPSESRDHMIAVGMATIAPGSTLPTKPETRL